MMGGSEVSLISVDWGLNLINRFKREVVNKHCCLSYEEV